MPIAPTAVFFLRPHLGYPRQPDRHDFHECIVVARGDYRAVTETGALEVTAGGAVIYPAGLGHRATREGTQPTFFCIQWPATEHRFPKAAIVAQGPALRLITAARWLHEQALRPHRSPVAEAGLLEALIDEIRTQATATDSEPDDAIAMVRRILDANYDRPQALGDLATIAGLGPRQLNRRFRKRYGCLPLEYLRRIRVEAAVTMLTNRQGSCEEVAQACGFGHASYLARVLRADTGLTARAIREGAASPSASPISDAASSS